RVRDGQAARAREPRVWAECLREGERPHPLGRASFQRGAAEWPTVRRHHHDPGTASQREGHPMRAQKEHPLSPTLKRQLIERQIDRRGFLRSAAQLGMSVSAAYGFVDWVAGKHGPRPAGAQTPRKGGTLKVATKADFTSFDPIIAVDYETWILVLNVFDVIVNYDKDGKLYPVIAKEIPKVSNGGQTLPFIR